MELHRNYEEEAKHLDIVEAMINFENGELNLRSTIKLFSHLIKTGKVWQLQGFYSKTANAAIAAGYLDNNGNINEEMINE